MTRTLTFLVIVLSSVCGVLLSENALVRRDQAAMLKAYERFLAHKVGEKTLADLVKPESLALFKSRAGLVGCALLKGG